MMITSSPYMNSKLPSPKLKSGNIQLPAQEQRTAEEAAGHLSKQVEEAGQNRMPKKGKGGWTQPVNNPATSNKRASKLVKNGGNAINNAPAR